MADELLHLPSSLLYLTFLFHQRHLLNKIRCAGKFIYHKKHISNININTALQFGIEGNITTHCFPITIKGNSYQLTISIHYRATGVATCDVIISNKASLQYTD